MLLRCCHEGHLNYVDFELRSMGRTLLVNDNDVQHVVYSTQLVFMVKTLDFLWNTTLCPSTAVLLGQSFVFSVQVRVPCINFQENTLSCTCHNIKAKNFIL